MTPRLAEWLSLPQHSKTHHKLGFILIIGRCGILPREGRGAAFLLYPPFVSVNFVVLLYYGKVSGQYIGLRVGYTVGAPSAFVSGGGLPRQTVYDRLW